MKPKTIPEQIKEAREAHGMTQAELAKVCGFNGQPAVARLEGGLHPARLDTLQRIAKALRTPLTIWP